MEQEPEGARAPGSWYSNHLPHCRCRNCRTARAAANYPEPLETTPVRGPSATPAAARATELMARRRARRRDGGNGGLVWLSIFVALIVAFAAAMWPVDGYGEGALWDLKRAADENIRAPIVGVLEGGSESVVIGPDGQLPVVPAASRSSVEDTADSVAAVGIKVAHANQMAFYELVSKCGGGLTIRDALVEAYVRPKVDGLQDEYRRDLSRQGFSNASAKLKKGEFDWTLETSAKHPVAEVGTIKTSTPLILHMSEQVDGFATTIVWRIELGDGMFADELATGTIGPNCATQ